MASFRVRRVGARTTTLVVFHCSPEDVAKVNVAVGPCVPRLGVRGGRVRPLASPLDQWPDRLGRLESLYALLTGNRGGYALTHRQTVGRGTIAQLSDDLTSRLAELSTVNTAIDSTVADQLAVAQRWFDEDTWPPAMQLGGVRARLLSWALDCRAARELGHLTYCWEGPKVPAYGIARGVGPESYDAYRKSGA